MAEFDLDDLKKIASKQEIIDFLVDKEIIKEKKFKEQLAYEKELERLQRKLNKIQAEIIENNRRVLIIFEGRDAAGKGGTISRITQYLNPKKVKVIALPKPTEIESGQWYFQRYLTQLPNKGELVFFDRSWYNRAVVEPVFGFCTEQQHELFLKQVNEVENLLQQDGVEVIKLFLDISKSEQADRLEERKTDPLKKWKLGSLDQQAQDLWDTYTKYIDKMLNKTNQLAWHVIRTDEKKSARLESMKLLANLLEKTSEENLDQEIVKIYN